MHQYIKDILEIVSEVLDEYNSPNNRKSIISLRNDAVNNIAKRRGRDRTSIADSYIRRTDGINDTHRFDDLLEDFIINKSTELHDIIYRETRNSQDRIIIDSAFSLRTNEDKNLSYEFNYEPNDRIFIEGKERFKYHISKERNKYLVTDAKKKWRKEYNGNIRCKICGFSFLDFYGHIGKDFIEAHHILPIASLEKDTIMKISDLCPVCSNCHRILHRHKPMLSVDELRNILSNNK